MKNILLIGGNGFIGKNVIDYLDRLDLESSVKIIVLTRTVDRSLESKYENVIYYCGDFSNLEFLQSLFFEFKFDAVFHFANTIVPSSINDRNIQDIHENVIPTIQLMDIMKKFNCNFLLYLSSGGAVYGNFSEALKEEHLCKPISSYGIAKLTIENYIQLYHRLFNLDFLILRVSNPYGRFHTSSKQGIINIAIRNALKNEPIFVWGNGKQTKDYIFVDDISKVVWRLFEKGVKNEIFNVGSGFSVSLNEILNRISDLLPDINIHYEASKVTDVNFFQLDIEKLKKNIEFEPMSLDSGILKTIEWEKMKKQ